MTRIRPIHVIHAAIALIIGGFALYARWVWAALVSEYGARGPNGEYLYKIHEPGTQVYIWITGIVFAGAIALVYWFVAMLASYLVCRVLDRKGRRRKRGQCEKCGYPIGKSPICTECGAAVTHPRKAEA